MLQFSAERGIAHLCDGTNADDIGDYRPGLRALKELRVRSPFKELGIGKTVIRELARAWGLPNWDEPPAACLASRIPYGQTIMTDKLARIDQAEAFLRERLGVRVVRVRHDGATARIETTADDIARLAATPARLEIAARLRELGFQYVALDLDGYRTGSLNEVL